ncbi:MAG: Lrp/AsnC family transcriptional regulator [Thaumarchaeota archaeon]|nr:Lrp/AsnC family transcriptional regulator [Nitrososphaerota archaeon]
MAEPEWSRGRMLPLDRLDILLAREIADLDANSAGDPSFRKPIHSIAKKLGVDENTIRSRMERWRKTGYLRGWWLGINPTLLGLQMFQVWLDVHPDSLKSKAIKKIGALNEVGSIKDYFGDSLSVSLYCQTESEFKITLNSISRICNSEKVNWIRSSFPNCQISLSDIDWKIIASLQSNPWKSFTTAGKEVGVSTRTVSRRVLKMAKSNTAFLLVDINPKAMKGAIFADLLVFYENLDAGRKVVERAIKRLDEMIIFREPGANHCVFALQLENISNVKEILHWIRNEPGVSEARLDILEDIILLRDARRVKLGMELKQDMVVQPNNRGSSRSTIRTSH